MPVSLRRELAAFALSALIIAPLAVAWAEKAETEMHRRGATADDGSG